jgi:hypothetical protein
MARCLRAGVLYKRHRFKNKKCEACGAPQKPKLAMPLREFTESYVKPAFAPSL